ncbi:MAG: ATP phosphoribosyltransferase [Candidatus Omnitrophica bacterium]|nr:ATP phosphoribosyltransferase [Candidatus Omnitrophota bacterium]
MKLKLGIPKGSLQESTIRIFKKAGFDIRVSERSYIPYIDDPDIDPLMLRAQEMSEYVENGTLDCGITGNDWIMEKGSSVVKVSELIYAKRGMQPVRWVLAVPAGSRIKSAKDLKGKRIATELVSVTKKYLKRKKIQAEVDFSWGATEVKANMELVDAIVELTETGSSLKANNLKIIDTICTSTTQLIANRKAYKDKRKREKIDNIALLLKGAILAENKVGLKMNVSKKDLKRVLSILPAMKRPTISSLSQEGWVDVDTILDESTVKNIIPKLKKAGAQGIVEYPLNKVIY